MENIVKLLEIAGILILICGVIIALIYPIIFNIKFKECFGRNGISYCWTVIQMIGIFGIYCYAEDSSSNGFSQALGFTVIIFIVAMVRNYKRIKKFGIEKSICWLAVLAQAIAPFGVFFIIIIISVLIHKTTENDKK